MQDDSTLTATSPEWYIQNYVLASENADLDDIQCDNNSYPVKLATESVKEDIDQPDSAGQENLPKCDIFETTLNEENFDEGHNIVSKSDGVENISVLTRDLGAEDNSVNDNNSHDPGQVVSKSDGLENVSVLPIDLRAQDNSVNDDKICDDHQLVSNSDGVENMSVLPMDLRAKDSINEIGRAHV